MRGSATGRLLTDPRGGRSFVYDAGAVCLDFAHTGGEGRYAVFESLHDPADLRAWLGEPPLGIELERPVTRPQLAEAKQLRQAIWVTAHARAHGEPLPADSLATLNTTAAAAPLVPDLDADGRTVLWRGRDARRALSSMAREMIELLSGPLSDRFRECAGDPCPMVFVDSSRPGARRWCAMERCGNRHKQGALRARRASRG